MEFLEFYLAAANVADAMAIQCGCVCKQADVSAVQSESVRTGQARQVHNADGRRRRRRLPIQVPQLTLDGRRQGRPGDAEGHVHPPGLTVDWRAVDEQTSLLPQTQAHQQHLRQTRIRESARMLYRLKLQWFDLLRICRTTSAIGYDKYNKSNQWSLGLSFVKVQVYEYMTVLFTRDEACIIHCVRLTFLRFLYGCFSVWCVRYRFRLKIYIKMEQHFYS